MGKAKVTCDCGDRGCPVHKGSEACPNAGTVLLGRSDYGDRDRMVFCEQCAEDALAAGPFFVVDDIGEQIRAGVR
jgi:hypothetical protein